VPVTIPNIEEDLHFEEYGAGKPLPQTRYESFLPPLNHGWNWRDARVNALLEEAIQAPGELNAFSRIVPDVENLFCERMRSRDTVVDAAKYRIYVLK